MNKYQNELYGRGATPDAEEELCFLIQLDTASLRVEDCSNLQQPNQSTKEYDIEIRITNRDDQKARWSDLI